MFIVNLSYLKPLDVADQFMAEHIAFLNHYFAQGVFIASGRKVPRTGGIILANASSRDALEEILAHDPFKREAIARFEIIEFTPTKMRAGFEAFTE